MEKFDKEFLDNYLSGKNSLYCEISSSDAITPVSALSKLSPLSKFHLLYESVLGGEKRGRYSIISLKPIKIWKCEKGKSYTSNGEGDNFSAEEEKSVFASLRNFVEEFKVEIPREVPKMASGVFGFMGYDMVKLMEKLPDEKPANIDIPESIYFQAEITLVFDNIFDKLYICKNVIHNNNISAEEALSEAKEDLKLIINRLNQEDSAVKIKTARAPEKIDFKSNLSKDEYFKIVDRCKKYIKDGDIFQIVPSRRFSAEFTNSPLSFYRSLRSLNPSPYLFYLNLDNFTLVGSSPEILVKLENEVVTIRPIAGTRKRGQSDLEDTELKHDLLADKKELAEHLMLLDLGRNDVGRVAESGTVKVTEKMKVEKYSHVMHIVSNVEGKLRKGKNFLDCLIAGFPAGTVSGAPKIRAMEIIDEMEPEKRQFYAGTVGYFSSNGEMDTCIALRTALIKDNKIYIQSGGGVVYDSNPQAEFDETQNKAAALQKAAELAINYD